MPDDGHTLLTYVQKGIKNNTGERYKPT